MTGSPVFLLVIFLCCGIYAGEAFGQFTIWFLLGLPIAAWIHLVAPPFKGRNMAFILACGATIMGIGSAQISSQRQLPNHHISLFSGRQMTIKGCVKQGASEKKASLVAVMDCSGEHVGKILLKAPSTLEKIPHHSFLETKVWVQDLPAHSPGYSNYLKSQGILAIGQVESWKTTGREGGLGYTMTEMQHSLIANLRQTMLDPQMAGLAGAMFLGDRSTLDAQLKSDFSATGLSHILSISGMHVAIFYLFLNHALGFMGHRLFTNRLRTLLILLVLVIYMALTGFSPAVCRSVLMLSMLKLSEIFFFQKNSFNILSLTAFLMLLVDPSLFFDLGFQLSFLAVAGLLLFSPPIEQFLGCRASWMPSWLKMSLATTLAAQAITTPLVVYHFQTFPTYFVLANLILLPLVTVATNMGIAAVLLGWIPGIGTALGALLDTILWTVSQGSSLIAKLPGATIQEISLRDQGFCILLALSGLGAAYLFRKEMRTTIQRVFAKRSAEIA